MIAIDRSTVSPPAAWTAGARKAYKKAENYFRKDRRGRGQTRHGFDDLVWRQARPFALELFRKKCAYCETPISDGELDHFRPKSEATQWSMARSGSGVRGLSVPDAYWWLAYEWSNIYLSCTVCSRSKKNLFPVGKERATAPLKEQSPRQQKAALAREQALLLDPCLDDPADFFDYDPDGYIRSRALAMARPAKKMSAAQLTDRAQATIEIFGLNRKSLVEERKREAAILQMAWAAALRQSGGPLPGRETLKGMLDPARSHAGLRRFLIGLWTARAKEASLTIGTTPETFPKAVLVTSPEAVAGTAPFSVATEPPVKRAGGARKVGKARKTGGTRKARAPRARAPRAAAPALPTSAFAQVSAIEIHDFRAIRDLTLTLPEGATNDEAGWLVLLGENGAGKSSALQAIALAMAGPEYVRRHMREFKLKASHFLRRTEGRKTVPQATVRVRLQNDDEFGFTVTRRTVTFQGIAPPWLFMRAYGATRLLPRSNQHRPAVTTGIARKAVNLFDPAKPVVDANAWIARLKGESFDSTALALKDLLELPEEATLRVTRGTVLVPVQDAWHGIDDLSAGYESILAVVGDIMAGVLGSVHDLRQASGIVLIDELDAHLHPRWKMRIVGALRRTFSSMQFIVTTHEPLCLRGIKDREVVLFKREDDEITYTSDLPSPASLRVDQLLTSELFGLHSVIDPTLDRKFQSYYRLLAKGEEQLTKAERESLVRLRGELPPVQIVRMLGDTAREQLIYEAVDTYLAHHLVHNDVDTARKLSQTLGAAREDVKKRIAEIWSRSAVMS